MNLTDTFLRPIYGRKGVSSLCDCKTLCKRIDRKIVRNTKICAIGFYLGPSYNRDKRLQRLHSKLGE